MAAAAMLTVAAPSAQLAASLLTPQVSFPRVQAQGAWTTTRAAPRLRLVCMATPTGSSGPAINTDDKVATKIEDAQEVCAGDNQSEECAAAWDEVEAAAKEQAKTEDPIDKYCNDNPEADECRVYNTWGICRLNCLEIS